MRSPTLSWALEACLFLMTVSLVGKAQAKAVFAHYMIGTTDEIHAHTDIDQASAIGLDGFALNIGDPTQPYVRDSLNHMFDYARDTHPTFKLFISMDLSAARGAGKGINDYHDLLQEFLGHAAWYLGPNGHPFISTFGDGQLTNAEFAAWKSSWANALYFVPDLDNTQGYYTADPGWWQYWGDVVDGLFSWEAAWPSIGGGDGRGPGDVSLDQVVANGAASHLKSYMIALSPLQYKDAYDTNLYRPGGLNLPVRMSNILSLSPSPDYVEVITWNDGPESHYIGTIWPEQNSDPRPARYATQVSAPHNGWQTLLTSFITAYKAGLPPSSMQPASGTAVGAMWYKTILQSSTCPNDGADKYTANPDGFSSGKDELTWAIVLSSGLTGMKMRAITNGAVLETVDLVAGLNYGVAGPVQAGAQRMEVLDAGGNVSLAGAGGRCVSARCPDCIYNMNPQVVALGPDTGAVAGSCPSEDCAA